MSTSPGSPDPQEPPATLTADFGDGPVTATWTESLDVDADGFEVGTTDEEKLATARQDERDYLVRAGQAKHPADRALFHKRAAQHRAEARSYEGRLPSLSLISPRPRGPRRRSSHQRPVRRTSGSRGDPPGGEEGEQAPVDEVAVQIPAESLLWRLRFWWNPDPWAIREAPLGLWRVRVWWVRRLEAKGLLG